MGIHGDEAARLSASSFVTGERRIPLDIEEAIILYFRNTSGRGARVDFSPTLQCPVILVDLRPDDPRLKAWRDGRLKVEPKETIFLHHRVDGHLVPLPLEEYGPGGITEWLARADVMSGRGEYRNLTAAVQGELTKNEDKKRELRKQMEEAARDSYEYNKDRGIFDFERNHTVSVPKNIGNDADPQE